MRKFFSNNGLTVVLLALFLISIVGQWLTGWAYHNEELARHGGEAIGPIAFLGDPQFLATVFENWESEFLQMSAFVMLTAILVQKGAAESKKPDDGARDDDLGAKAHRPGAPRILMVGPVARWVYSRSLGITLFILFLISFLLHWWNSANEAAGEARQHGERAMERLQYFGDAQFWFESFQNWQSEFLATAVLIVLSIWLRQRESPESKPVAAPHAQTGTE
jgi:hypothetical protein